MPTMLRARAQRKALAKLVIATRSRFRREIPISMGVSTLTKGMKRETNMAQKP